MPYLDVKPYWRSMLSSILVLTEIIVTYPVVNQGPGDVMWLTAPEPAAN